MNLIKCHVDERKEEKKQVFPLKYVCCFVSDVAVLGRVREVDGGAGRAGAVGAGGPRGAPLAPGGQRGGRGPDHPTGRPEGGYPGELCQAGTLCRGNAVMM